MNRINAFAAAVLTVAMLILASAVLGQTPGTVDEGIPVGRLFFTSDRGEEDLDVWMLEAGATEPVRLTSGPNVDWRAVVSPDGSTVLFMSDREAFSARNSPGLRAYALYLISSDGSDERLLYGSQSFNATGGWSPDGTSIVIQSDISGTHQIHFVSIDIVRGQTPPLLATDLGDAARPAWSPDGTRIVFDSSRQSDDVGALSNREIYVIDVDGTEEQRLTDDPGTDMEAEWSPDGSMIAFQTDRNGEFDIYVMAMDGSGLTRLTDDPASDSNPTWSPDGSMIAFETVRDGDLEIYVMKADGTGQRNVTNNPADGVEYPGEDSFPAWAP